MNLIEPLEPLLRTDAAALSFLSQRVDRGDLIESHSLGCPFGERDVLLRLRRGLK